MKASILVLASLLLVACDQPPAKEIAAAEIALGQARQAGADRYAVDRFKEAEAALHDAQRKVQEKDYRGALSSATEAAERSRAAAQAAGAARTVVRGAAEVAQAEVQAVLDELRKEAADAKVPDAAFEELAPAMTQAREGLASLQKLLDSGELLEAQKSAAALKGQVGPLPARFREALEAWRKAHPRGRKPAPKKTK